ncbi:MAG: glycosyltransferase family 4 protein [Sediminibacterium sp.]|jgi:phosphatidylinositol alpha-1,6-mannosyltransferase
MQLLTTIQFIYLTAFSKTGGMEKFNKNVIFCLQKSKDRYEPIIASLHDSEGESAYCSNMDTYFFAGNKIKFLVHCLRTAKKTKVLLVGHINLSPIVCLMRVLNPKMKTIVFTHGVEVWKPLSGLDAAMMRFSNRVLCVSKFTKRMLKEANDDISRDKIFVFLNAVNPFYEGDKINEDEVKELSRKLSIQSFKPIILSVGRICKEDAYKGFDLTIQALAEVKRNGLHPLYLLVGKYEDSELQRLLQLAEVNGIREHVIFLGFVPDKALTSYCKLADLFVMPSKGEGFGIVFIEAIRNQMAIIAANTGGTPEALGYGKYGRLVDPDNIHELATAIREEYYKKRASNDNNWSEIMHLYGIERFCNELNNHIQEVLL